MVDLLQIDDFKLSDGTAREFRPFSSQYSNYFNKYSTDNGNYYVFKIEIYKGAEQSNFQMRIGPGYYDNFRWIKQYVKN